MIQRSVIINAIVIAHGEKRRGMEEIVEGIRDGKTGEVNTWRGRLHYTSQRQRISEEGEGGKR